MSPTLSVIIPAWNEEKYIAQTIDSLQRAARYYERQRGCSAELVVVDNNSQDRTAQIAEREGVTVVFEPVNNIGRARNTGARAARGKYLAFCDADNRVTENLLCLVHDHLERDDIVGGGTWIEPDRSSFKIRFFYAIWHQYVRFSRVGVGMMHCRREDFLSFNGFDETIYAAEDIQFAYDLRRLGEPRKQRFELIRDGWIITSTRKIDQMRFDQMIRRLVGFGFGLQKKIRSKDYCRDWYDNAAR
jgi:glycosyltransferase involved in cell wall biosynthesis